MRTSTSTPHCPNPAWSDEALAERARSIAARSRGDLVRARRLCAGAHRLAWLLQHTPPGTFAGSYLGWLTRYACDAAGRDDHALLTVLEGLSRGGSIATFERSIALFLGPLRLGSTVFPPPIARAFAARIGRLDLTVHARGALTSFVHHCERSACFSTDVALEALEPHAGEPELVDLVLRRAPASPVGVLRVAWACGALGAGDLVRPKLAELLDSGAAITDPLAAEQPDVDRGGQPFAWVEDARFCDFARRLHERMRSASAAHAARRTETTRVLRSVAVAPGSWRERILQAFACLDDVDGRCLIDDVARGELELVVLPAAELRAFCERMKSELAERIDRIGALYAPSAAVGDRIGPTIALKLDRGERAPHELLGLMAMAIHEHEHFVHFGARTTKTRDDVVIGEMRAFTREALWLAARGRTEAFEARTHPSCQGYAMGLRAELERGYLTRRLGLRGALP